MKRLSLGGTRLWSTTLVERQLVLGSGLVFRRIEVKLLRISGNVAVAV